MSAARPRQMRGTADIEIRACAGGHVHLVIKAEELVIDMPFPPDGAVRIADMLMNAVEELRAAPPATIPN